jgi:NAD(P)-dependent dehydrogenase (short-subunit alcohol dehydrogenase family)
MSESASTDGAAKRLAGRTAVITGASRGIGRAVALGFAREGAHVIAIARTKGALEELDDDIRAEGGAASLITLNLKQGDKVDALGPTLYQRWPHIDIFVANAGVLGTLTPVAHIQDRDWDEVMGVNVTANMRLIRTLDPLLRRSDAGRAIFVSSGVADAPRAYWGEYATSKAALETLALTYAAETAQTPMCVNIVNPGRTRTAMRAAAYPGEDPATLKAPDAVVPLFVDLAAPDCKVTGQRFDFEDYAAKAGSR